MPQAIAVERLLHLLTHSPVGGADLAAPAARDLSSTSLPVTQRPAREAASTLGRKYSMALRRGHTVSGLSDLLAALRQQVGDIAAVRIEAPGEYFLVELDEHLTDVMGVLHVIPRRRDEQGKGFPS